jgi:drug/metabolite transporter (DMT)-like permease
MALFAIVLILISAAMHAGWNFISKSKAASSAFFAVATLASIVMMLPLYVYYAPFVHLLSPGMWCIFVATGFCSAAYLVAIAKAYRLHDISFVYPLARALPVLFVAVLCFAISYGKPLSVSNVVGLAAIVIGCTILPFKSARDTATKITSHRPALLILVAALATAAYTVIDSIGLTHLRRDVPQFSALDAALFFLAYQAACTLVFLSTYVLSSRRERHHFKTLMRHSAQFAVYAGLVFKASYALVLLAMQFVSNVSYIVAFRQSSILFGVFFGVVLLRERMTAFKGVGVAMIFIGLILNSVS